MKLGFLGLGAMGVPMAKNLIEADPASQIYAAGLGEHGEKT